MATLWEEREKDDGNPKRNGRKSAPFFQKVILSFVIFGCFTPPCTKKTAESLEDIVKNTFKSNIQKNI